MDEEKRTGGIVVKLTKKEKEEIQKKANDAGLTDSAYVRYEMLKLARRLNNE